MWRIMAGERDLAEVFRTALLDESHPHLWLHAHGAQRSDPMISFAPTPPPTAVQILAGMDLAFATAPKPDSNLTISRGPTSYRVLSHVRPAKPSRWRTSRMPFLPPRDYGRPSSAYGLREATANRRQRSAAQHAGVHHPLRVWPDDARGTDCRTREAVFPAEDCTAA